jgi:opacity protein-like surface antigen
VKKFIGAVVILVSLLFVPGANAAETGFYIGAGGQYAWQDFNNLGSLDVDNSSGLNLRAGYEFAKYLALEANYDWYNGFDFKWQGDKYGSLEVQTFLLDLKLMYPIQRFVPYARVGAGWMWTNFDYDHWSGHNISSDDFAWDFGAGVDVYLTPQISLGPSLRYVMGTGDLQDVKYLTLGFGLSFHF